MCVCLVAQSCPTHFNPMDCSPIYRFLCIWGFSRQEFWSGLSCPPSGDLLNPGIKPRYPTLQANSLLSEPPGKPKNTGVGSLFLLHGELPYGLNQGLLNCRWILYQLSYEGSPKILEWVAYPFSRGSSQPRNQIKSPALQADSLPSELSGKPSITWSLP